jgi:hypothetical protein
VRSIGDRSTDVISSLIQHARKICPDLTPEYTTILPSGVAVGTKDWCRIYECIGRRGQLLRCAIVTADLMRLSTCARFTDVDFEEPRALRPQQIAIPSDLTDALPAAAEGSGWAGAVFGPVSPASAVVRPGCWAVRRRFSAELDRLRSPQVSIRTASGRKRDVERSLENLLSRLLQRTDNQVSSGSELAECVGLCLRLSQSCVLQEDLEQ